MKEHTTPTTIALTNFRANLYTLVDQVLTSGQPLLIERNGKIIEVREHEADQASPTAQPHNLAKLKRRHCLTEEADWYISPQLEQWSAELDQL